MARIKYYYNTITCQFEKATLTAAAAVKAAFSYVVLGSIVAAIVITAFYYLDVNPEERALRNENRELRRQITAMNGQLTQLETDIESLHKMDAEVYRTLLNAEPLPPTVWEAGTGGSANTELEEDAMLDTKSKLEKMQSKVEVQRASFLSVLGKYEDKKEELMHIPSVRPVKGDLISGFGIRMHPILKFRKMHTGLDFQAPIGTAVIATADGVVEHCGVKDNGYGIHVDINHGYGYTTKYAHLSKANVKPGQKVRRGDVIGFTGDTGLSKGPHLHYEILKNGEKIDPVDYFYSDLGPEEYIALKQMASQENGSMD